MDYFFYQRVKLMKHLGPCSTERRYINWMKGAEAGSGAEGMMRLERAERGIIVS